MFVEIPIDQKGTIGNKYHNLSIQGVKFLTIMTQLRHMINAMWSGKADVEHQQNILFAVNV